jgi:RHS repeat-associated protein
MATHLTTKTATGARMPMSASTRRLITYLGAIVALLAAVPARAQNLTARAKTDGSTPPSPPLLWKAYCILDPPTPPWPPDYTTWWPEPGGRWGRYCGENLPVDEWLSITYTDSIPGFDDRLPVRLTAVPNDLANYYGGSQAIFCFSGACGSPWGDQPLIFARRGSAHGYVRTPEGTPIAGMAVWPYNAGGSGLYWPRAGGPVTTDADGRFDFTPVGDPIGTPNHWGLPVDPAAFYGPNGDFRYSFGFRQYAFLPLPQGAPAPDSLFKYNLPPCRLDDGVYSSKLSGPTYALCTEFELGENPSNRLGGGSGSGEELPESMGMSFINEGAGSCEVEAPSAVGKPVNVMTGDVFFSQLDAQVAGVRRVVSLFRSYSSQRAYAGKVGAFGRGWEHSYEKAVTLVGTKLLRLNDGTGAPAYFQDQDGDQTFIASIPLTERSTITKSETGYVRNFLGGGSETYDALGRLVRQTDAVGNVTEIQRDGSGRLTAIVAPGGRTLTLGYTGERVTSLSGPDGEVATYGYQGDLLTTVAYVGGTGYTFTYDTSGQVLTVKDATGRTLETHTYNGDRGLTTEIADGQEKYTLNYQGGATVVTDAVGNVTTYSHAVIAGQSKVYQVEGTCGSCGGGSQVQNWQYDAKGRVTAHIVDGERWEYDYDANGFLVAKRDPTQAPTTFNRDGQGRVLTLTGRDGATLGRTYTAPGIATVTDPLNRTTTITYDTRGLPVTVTTPRAAVRGKTKTLAYDGFGDLVSVADELGNTTSFTYDSFGRLLTTTAPFPPDTTVTLTRDVLGRVTRVIYPDGTHSDFTYDGSGQRETATDPMGRTTRWSYDAYGRVKTTQDPAGGVTAFSYDAMSRLVSLSDALGRTTRWEYDVEGQLTALVYPGGARETYTYDERGRLKTKTDRKGVITTYSYDTLDRLVLKTHSDGTPSLRLSYDPVGRLLTAANGTDSLAWKYDAAGQVEWETSQKNGTKVSYSYDEDGSRQTLSLNDAPFTSYGYDDAGRLTSITRGTNVFTFEYDAANRRTRMRYPNGVVTTYTYDQNSRLLTLKAQKDGTAITDFTYTYDAAGNRASKSQPGETEAYTYDVLSQLTGVNRTGASPRQWFYRYDAVGNRLSEQADSSVTRASHNALNQLVSLSAGGPLRIQGTLDEPGTVTVNGTQARQPSATTFEADLNLPPGTHTVTVQATDARGNPRTQTYEVDVTGSSGSFAYDPNGNLTAKTDSTGAWTYEWNALNQLVRVDKDGTEVARFAYDPLGRRLEKASAGATTAYAYDGADILRETATGAAVRYVHGPGIDEPLAKEDGSGALSPYHADALGTVTKTTDFTGTVTLTREYDAWGNLQQGGTVSGYAFTGREWDPEVGLFYYRARYYAPQLGRFVAEDPLGFVSGINHNVYVQNSPVNLIDPSGMAQYVMHVPGRPDPPGPMPHVDASFFEWLGWVVQVQKYLHDMEVYEAKVHHIRMSMIFGLPGPNCLGGLVARGTSQAIRIGTVRGGSKLAGVLRAMEAELTTSAIGSADDALLAVHRAATSVGLGIPLVLREGGGYVIPHVGRVVTTIRATGEVLVRKANDLVLHIIP